jgi:predicted metalloprotease with PDZ domain
MVVGKDGVIKDIVPGKPADRAGIGPGMKLLAVDGRRWAGDSTEEILRAAVAATKQSTKRLELILENGEYVRSFSLDYHDGEKYPRLERIPGKEDRLSAIIKSLP